MMRVVEWCLTLYFAAEYDLHPGIVRQIVRRHWPTLLVRHMDAYIAFRS